jgi:uncharacterized surface anchored protein
MKTRILLPTLALLLVLASCSSSRFGYVPKVKAKKQTAVAQKAPEKKNINTSAIIETKKQPATEVVVNYEIAENNSFSEAAPLKSDVKTNKTQSTTVSKPAKTGKTNSLQDVLSPKQQRKLRKAEKLAKTTEAKHGGLWYIIVGLILILIGAVLAAIGLGIVGWLFWLVGIIAIIYGLLVIIDVV